MGVHDEVGGGVVEGGPVGGALEVVLEHERDAFVDLGDLLQGSVDVGVDPVCAVEGQAVGGAEAGEVGVGGFVDGGDGEGLHAVAGLDKVEDTVDGLEGVVEVGRVEEPVAVAEGFADVETVDTAGQAVETDDDVHAVLVDGVVGDLAEPGLLVTGVELGAGDLDPGGVGGWDAESVDTDGGH